MTGRIRIDELNPTFLENRDHELPAMRDGIAVKLSVAQILGLLQSGDIPADAIGTTQIEDGAVVNAKLADMAAGTIKGRTVGSGTGPAEDISVGAGLTLAAGVLASSAGRVVMGSTSTNVVVSTTTYTATGLTATITPSSAASRILVLIDQQYSLSRGADNVFGGVRLLRGSTVIVEPVTDSTGPFDLALSAGGATSVSAGGRLCMAYLDAPDTTSPVTYSTQGRPYEATSSGVMTFQDTGGTTNATSHIVLVEVIPA